MITGDHPITATVVAGELGLDIAPEQVITSGEWEALSADGSAPKQFSITSFSRG